MHYAEPLAKRLVRILENRVYQYGKAIAGLWRAVVALPVPRLRGKRSSLKAAARAMNYAVWPAVIGKVGFAVFFGFKFPFKLTNAHLVNVMRLLRYLAISALPLDSARQNLVNAVQLLK